MSTVHGLPSSHWAAVSHSHASRMPEHMSKPPHVDADVHVSPSSHAVPLGAGASAGHCGEMPSQRSAASHLTLALAARHTCVLLRSALAGQLALLPGQVAAMSHSPLAARHCVPLRNVSVEGLFCEKKRACL